MENSKLYKVLRNEHQPLFTFSGVDIHDVFVDESGVDAIDPIVYYGVRRIMQATDHLLFDNASLLEAINEGISMLLKNNFVLIPNRENASSDEVIYSIEQVLTNLRISFRRLQLATDQCYYLEVTE